jgi:hypothetical protein
MRWMGWGYRELQDCPARVVDQIVAIMNDANRE